MSDEKKPVVPVVAPVTKPTETATYTFDETKVKEHFKKIEDAVNAVQGKKGYNPYLYLSAKVNPLMDQYINGVRTRELFDAIMNLSTEIKPVF